MYCINDISNNNEARPLSEGAWTPSLCPLLFAGPLGLAYTPKGHGMGANI